MRNVTLQSHITLDDNGNVVKCRMGTAPGFAPMFSVEFEGSDSLSQCVTAVRRQFKMDAYRSEFDAAMTKGAA